MSKQIPQIPQIQVSSHWLILRTHVFIVATGQWNISHHGDFARRVTLPCPSPSSPLTPLVDSLVGLYRMVTCPPPPHPCTLSDNAAFSPWSLELLLTCRSNRASCFVAVWLRALFIEVSCHIIAWLMCQTSKRGRWCLIRHWTYFCLVVSRGPWYEALWCK